MTHAVDPTWAKTGDPKDETICLICDHPAYLTVIDTWLHVGRDRTHDVMPIRWIRKDGVKGTISEVGGGSRRHVDLKLATGRVATMSEASLRRNYTPDVEQP